MSEAIKDLCRRRASLHSSHVEAMRSDDYVAEVSGDTLLAVLLAIDALEGVASGKDKIVPVDPSPDMCIAGGIAWADAQRDAETPVDIAASTYRAMLSAVEKKEAGND